jgi:hypothetical protein
MPSIVGKRRGKQTYYYLVESARVDGKPRIVSQEYLGTAEELTARLQGEASGVPDRTQHKRFGDLAAVWVVEPPWVRWRLGSLDSNRLVGLRLVMVGGLVLGRWDVVEGAVQPHGVEPGDPAEGGELDVVDGLPGTLSGTADQLGLVQRVDRLSQRVGPSRQLHPIAGVPIEVCG